MPYQLCRVAPAAVDAELWVFAGENGRLGGPEGVGGLEAVRGVGGAEFSGLNDEGKKGCEE